ncbi:hypothetical protein [Blastopirellula marina]|uniref:Uncharacterized protein n=1 Tax=Blastopirellula marina TaxID=124 RepID=A0A2S8FD61_9BACT|nr:hypothetical protein [Blastopirellula marina]PQO30062.1 hypothetical protein C5Y98_21125 [Blastopirellula marina]PTL42500.1 hypothetical protein C5Y97_21135 [Blastopirellula marina]
MRQAIEKRVWPLAMIVSAVLLSLSGCSCDLAAYADPHAVKLGPVSSDVNGLRKLCTLPPGVKSCQWQTWSRMDQHGFGDWGLHAIVELDEPDSFAWGEVLRDVEVVKLPNWMVDFAGETFAPTAVDGEFVVDGTLHDPASVTKSPLLNGKVIQTPQKRLILMLYTM